MSFFLNHVAPGRGVDEHRHPCAEVLVVQGGEVIVSVDGIPVTARSGQVLVVPAGAKHSTRNSSARTLETISVHPAAEMVTEWSGPS